MLLSTSSHIPVSPELPPELAAFDHVMSAKVNLLFRRGSCFATIYDGSEADDTGTKDIVSFLLPVSLHEIVRLTVYQKIPPVERDCKNYQLSQIGFVVSCHHYLATFAYLFLNATMPCDIFRVALFIPWCS